MKNNLIVLTCIFVLSVCLLSVESGGMENSPSGYDERYLKFFPADKYGDFVDQLNLPDEDAKKLKILLTQREGIGDELLSPLPASEYDTYGDLAQAKKRRREVRTNKLREILGDENYARLIEYEESVKERFLVNDFINMLDPDPLDMYEEKDELIHVLYMARIQSDYTWFPTKETRPDRPDDIHPKLYEEKLLYEKYLDAVDSILDEHEKEVFNELIEQRIAQWPIIIKLMYKEIKNR